MSINLYMDTNIVKIINADLTKFELNETYTIVRDFIRDFKIEDVKIYIPSVVIKELTQQYFEEYKSLKQKVETQINDNKGLACRLGWQITVNKNFSLTDRDYKTYIKESSEEYLSNEQEYLNVIQELSHLTIEDILSQAISRREPFFEGKMQGTGKKFSDAGFKDVIFLESIMGHIQKVGGDNYILTQDKTLNKVEVEKQLEKRGINGCSCKFVEWNTGREVVNNLEELLGIEHKAEYIRFCRTDYYREAIENAMNGKLIEENREIELVEEDETFIDVHEVIRIKGVELPIVVRLSDRRDPINIYDKSIGEIIYQW